MNDERGRTKDASDAGVGVKASGRRIGIAGGLAVFFLLMGFGMRAAEDAQVGYTHDTSLWVFGVSALCAYYAVLMLFLLWRSRRPRG